MDTTALKKCPKCRKTKPIEEFGIERRRPDGRTARCLICRNEGARKSYAHSLESRRANRREKYAEKKSEGYIRIHPPRFYERMLEYYEECKEQSPKALHVRQRRASKVYRKKHPERVRAQNNSPANKAWHKAHPEGKAICQQRRRARQKGLPNTWTLDQRSFMLNYWCHSCAACGNPKGLFWTLADDHWIPLSSAACPGTVASNMIPLCHGKNGCNNSKNGAEAHLWLLSRFGVKRAAKIEKAIAEYFTAVALTFPEAKIA